MLGRWRKEGEGLFPTGTSPAAMHLPGRLRKAPSPTLDSTLKPKGPVSGGYSPELFFAIQMLPGLSDSGGNQVISAQP